MDTQDYISIGTQIITFIGVIFAIYLYFRNPQIKSEKTDIMLNQEIKQLTERVQLLINNDIHEIKGMLNKMSGEFTSVQVQLGKLETRLEERVPKKE